MRTSDSPKPRPSAHVAAPSPLSPSLVMQWSVPANGVSAPLVASMRNTARPGSSKFETYRVFPSGETTAFQAPPRTPTSWQVAGPSSLAPSAERQPAVPLGCDTFPVVGSTSSTAIELLS